MTQGEPPLHCPHPVPCKSKAQGGPLRLTPQRAKVRAVSAHGCPSPPPPCPGARAVVRHRFWWSSVSTSRLDQDPQDAWQSKAEEGFHHSTLRNIPSGHCRAQDTAGHKALRMPKSKQVPPPALPHGQIPGRSTQWRLTKTATSLGALLAVPLGVISGVMCSRVTQEGRILARSLMTTWPCCPSMGQHSPGRHPAAKRIAERTSRTERWGSAKGKGSERLWVVLVLVSG